MRLFIYPLSDSIQASVLGSCSEGKKCCILGCLSEAALDKTALRTDSIRTKDIRSYKIAFLTHLVRKRDIGGLVEGDTDIFSNIFHIIPQIMCVVNAV